MAQRDRRTQRVGFPSCLFCACLALLMFSPLIYAQTSAATSKSYLHAVPIGGAPYLSLEKLTEAAGGRLRSHRLKQKVELKLSGHTYVLTWLSSLVVVNDVAYRMPLRTRLHNGVLHVPAGAFLALLHPVIPEGRFQVEPSTVVPEPPRLTGPQPEPGGRELEIDPEHWTLDTVIIDPGHGGKDSGAVGPGKTKEKAIALRVARRLKTLLKKRLRVRAILTRDDDTFIPLTKRARIARENGGKIFLSLHCNASKNQRSRGAEVYFLSEAKTAEAAEVAKRENAVLDLKTNGADSSRLDPELDGIVSGLLSTQFLKESQDLSALIRTEIAQTVTGVQDRGVKQANFYVMRGTMGAMPSALIEMGFITNPSEEKRLRSTAFQKKMAEAIYRGLRTFKRRYEERLSTAK